MPYNRPGNIFYTANGSGGTLTHGQPVKSENVVGVAVKQKAPAWTTPYADQALIAVDEAYAIICKGVVQVAEVAGFAVGDAVYITSGNVLTETAGGNTLFGRVVEIENERGTPANMVRIDLDAKASI